MPTKIRDNRTVTYDLAPQVIVPTQELIDRANQLRQDTLQYPVAPAGGNGADRRRTRPPVIVPATDAGRCAAGIDATAAARRLSAADRSADRAAAGRLDCCRRRSS